MEQHKRVIETLIAKNKFLFFLTALIFIGAALGIGSIGFDNNLESFFSDSNKQYRDFEKIKNEFDSHESAIIIIEKDQNLLSRDFLRLLFNATEEAWQLPFVTKVSSLSNYNHTTVQGDDLYTAPLIRSLEHVNSINLINLEDIIENGNHISPIFISRDRKTTAIYLKLDLKDKGYKEKQEIIQALDDFKERMRSKNNKLTVHLSGSVPFDQAVTQVAQRDILILLPIILLICFFIMVACLGSIGAALCVEIVVILSVGITMGLCGWFNTSLNIVSASAPLLILILAMADSIHVINTYVEKRRQYDQYEALHFSLTENAMPIFWTSFTTAIGFLSLNLNDSAPFRDLGNFAAAGVLIAFFVTYTALPFLLLTLRAKGRHRNRVSMTWMNTYLSWLQVRKGRFLFVSLFVVIALSLPAQLNTFNDNPYHFIDENLPVRKALKISEEKLIGPNHIKYLIQSEHNLKINDVEFLSQVNLFTTWLEQQKETKSVFSFLNQLKKLNQDMNEGTSGNYRVPSSNDMAAQLVLLYELSLPAGETLEDFYNFDKSALLLRVNLKELSSAQILDFEKRVDSWLLENKKLVLIGSGQDIMFAHLSSYIVSNMMIGSLLALVLISLCLIVSLKSVKYGILAIIPNLFPAAITLGLWGIFSRDVNSTAAIVFCMSIGIIVDDTVHLLTRYVQHRKNGHTSVSALELTFESAGSAVLITSLLLVISFSIMSLSDFSMTSTAGSMMAVITLSAFIIDFFLLPCLLLNLDKN